MQGFISAGWRGNAYSFLFRACSITTQFTQLHIHESRQENSRERETSAICSCVPEVVGCTDKRSISSSHFQESLKPETFSFNMRINIVKEL
jgi:hypothetical protein